jgi:hypothetical protein
VSYCHNYCLFFSRVLICSRVFKGIWLILGPRGRWLHRGHGSGRCGGEGGAASGKRGAGRAVTAIATEVTFGHCPPVGPPRGLAPCHRVCPAFVATQQQAEGRREEGRDFVTCVSGPGDPREGPSLPGAPTPRAEPVAFRAARQAKSTPHRVPRVRQPRTPSSNPRSTQRQGPDCWGPAPQPARPTALPSSHGVPKTTAALRPRLPRPPAEPGASPCGPVWPPLLGTVSDKLCPVLSPPGLAASAPETEQCPP